MSELRYGPPTDPAYTRFAQGLNDVVEKKKDWRWHGRDQKWYFYDRREWLFEDAALPDTPAGDALNEDYSTFPPGWKVNDFAVVDLFRRVNDGYASITAKYPRIGHPVWSPWGGGDWRNAVRRGAGGGTGGTTKLPPEALARIARVRAFEARDDITADEAQEIINEIVREYT